MGVPTSEVGYTSAMPRREDHEVHIKDMWWHWEKKIFFYIITQTSRFSKKVIEYKMCFNFLYNLMFIGPCIIVIVEE
jgi:hypothetical protein